MQVRKVASTARQLSLDLFLDIKPQVGSRTLDVSKLTDAEIERMLRMTADEDRGYDRGRRSRNDD